MKTHVCKLALIALSALFLNLESSYAADTTPPDKATPGTAAETDTKSQENNPSGPAQQTNASAPADSKTAANTPNGTETQKTASGAGAKSSKKHHKHKKTTAATSAPSTVTPAKQ
jgi:hypothetical protein